MSVPEDTARPSFNSVRPPVRQPAAKNTTSDRGASARGLFFCPYFVFGPADKGKKLFRLLNLMGGKKHKPNVHSMYRTPAVIGSVVSFHSINCGSGTFLSSSVKIY